MTTFKVNYPNGKDSYVETCDAQTIEEFANRHFGSVDYAEHGITVEIVDAPIEEVIPMVDDEEDEEDEEE